MTNPIWVVKTRMFTSKPGDAHAYRNVFRTFSLLAIFAFASAPAHHHLACTDGISQLAKEEGVRGLSKGMVLALVGVSNGALQFMTYEELKRWRTELRRGQLGPQAADEEVNKLVSQHSLSND